MPAGFCHYLVRKTPRNVRYCDITYTAHVNILAFSALSCWLCGRKGIRPVKTEWWGAGVVICLERGTDLHMAQLMPLPLTVSCFSKIEIGLPFWYWLTWVVPEKGPLNVCVCAHVNMLCLPPSEKLWMMPDIPYTSQWVRTCPAKLPHPMRDGPPHNTFCLGPTQVHNPSAISTFNRFSIAHGCDQQTDTQMCTNHAKSVAIGHICGWRRGVVVSGVRRMNEVNTRRARLLPGWVTVFGRVYHLDM